MATRDKPLKDLVGVWPIFGYKFWIQILHLLQISGENPLLLGSQSIRSLSNLLGVFLTKNQFFGFGREKYEISVRFLIDAEFVEPMPIRWTNSRSPSQSFTASFLHISGMKSSPCWSRCPSSSRTSPSPLRSTIRKAVIQRDHHEHPIPTLESITSPLSRAAVHDALADRRERPRRGHREETEGGERERGVCI